MNGRRGLAAALAAFVVGAFLVVPATPARAGAGSEPVDRGRASPRLVLRPAVPTAGRAYRVSGRLPATSPRRALLQVRRDAGWRTRVRTTTTRRGAFRFSWTSRAPERVRVVAPALGRRPGRAARPRWVSAVTTVRPRSAGRPPAPAPGQVLRIAAPSSVLERQQVTITLTAEPARRGRGVVLQRRDSAGWTAVASAETDGAGVAGLSVTSGDVGAGDPGTEVYRAVLAGAAGLPEIASEPVEVLVRQGLPRVDITTDDGAPILDKSVYSTGSLAIEPRGSGLPGSAVSSRLRVRGNSTAMLMFKLPYKIKLDTKTSLLGMPTSKDWVLLANAYDRSLLRNDVAFEVARRVGLPWAPRMKDVELWLNGSYAGVYQLGEGIETGTDRLDIEVDDDDAAPGEAADGGYLLEADFWDDTDPRFRTTRGGQIYLKEPEFDTPEGAAPYLDRVRADVQEFEDALYSEHFTDPETGYRAYVDVASFVDWYLVNELMKNVDANYNASCWMYRDNGGRLSMGPVWDFDASSGSRAFSGLNDPTDWFLRKNWYPRWGVDAVSMFQGPEGHWLNRMFEDPWFVARVAARWRERRAELLSLPDYVASAIARLAPAAERNYAPREQGGAGMPIGNTFMDPDTVAFDTWTATVDHLDDWLTRRLAWMDGELRPADRR